MPREKTFTYPSRHVYLGRLMPDASASVRCQLSMLQIQCARPGARRICVSVQDLDCQRPRPVALTAVCITIDPSGTYYTRGRALEFSDASDLHPSLFEYLTLSLLLP